MSERADRTGGCACGAVRDRARVSSDEAYLCHCRMCQRATGSVSIAFHNLPQADVSWCSGPDRYRSSPIAERPFCSACGTSLGFRFLDSPEMDLTVASFDDPSCFRPTSHVGVESRRHAWEDLGGLPERRADEWQPTLDRWIKAVGRVPE